ncbi:MAG: hypothetical protein ACI30W_04585 [Muribaculaceae bacterium]
MAGSLLALRVRRFRHHPPRAHRAAPHRAPSGRAPRAAAIFRLKAVTTASLTGSMCISWGPPPPISERSEDSECVITARAHHTAPQPNRALSGRAPRAEAIFRLKAVTTASLQGSLCISRGQGRQGRPQPSDSSPHQRKSERRHLAPAKAPHNG